jgi:beta-lactam-binding protein with PASTA domain
LIGVIAMSLGEDRPIDGGRLMLIPLLMAAALLLLPSGVNSTAHSVEIQNPTVSINPTSGHPGTSATAFATGYGACPSDVFNDVSQYVAFFWDRELLKVVKLTGGSASTTFTVPDEPGDHEVSAQCDADGSRTESSNFTVLPVEIQTPFVSVDPTSGQPGTSATAFATGYGACPSDVFNDVSQYVVFFWDRELLKVVELTGGSASTTFTVPDEPGDHEVSAQCDADGSRTESSNFTVNPVNVPTVIVPNVVGMSVDEATRTLIAENLDSGEVSGDGDVVVGQDPLAGDEVPVGSTVDITVVADGPELVVVPNVVGLDVADASDVLAEQGLELGDQVGDGDVVGSQNPEADARVPPGSLVSISLDSTVPPPPLVAVPNLTGLTLEDAGATVAAAGLALGNGADGDGKVQAQDPAPGTLVPVGTAVTLTLASSTETPWWPVAVAVLALLLAVASAAFKATRPRRDRRWLRKHMRLIPGAASAPEFDVREPRTEQAAPTLVVRLQPRADGGMQVLEEITP